MLKYDQLNVNQATREHLERYVEKKIENSKKPQESDIEGSEKEQESVPGVEENENLKSSVEDSKKDGNESVNKENQDNATFGIVTDEDREADHEALEKLTSMMEERMKTKPLPPPPTQGPADGSENTNSELPTKSRDSDVDIMRNGEVYGVYCKYHCYLLLLLSYHRMFYLLSLIYQQIVIMPVGS